MKRTILFAGFIYCLIAQAVSAQVQDIYTPLADHSVHLHDDLENDIQNSIAHWSKGVVPYSGFVKTFKTGREYFAQGEMWGKAVRSGAMLYRYTHDPELKKLLDATVTDLLSAIRTNGSISASEIAKQPDGPGGDLWERKYVLLGLDEYYTYVRQDPAVLKAMISQADVLVDQIGPAPKVRIVDQGWSPNHIESSTVLEPIMRLYKRTNDRRYLEFAKYIVEVEGGAKDYNIIQQALDNIPPHKMGGPYPKAYEMMSLFEGLVEYYRTTGDPKWKAAILNLYQNIRKNEITIIGNGGGDQPYHWAVYGEAWDNTALEQTNPKMKRMMETCVGVTWIKLCSQILRLTGDPSAAAEIEKYVYNGLIGAMKPSGDGFSYVNLLNGVKTNTQGWGGKVDGVDVTCCNLNGPMGLAYIPYVSIMQSARGPVVNLYNSGRATAKTASGRKVELQIEGDFTGKGKVSIRVKPQKAEKFTLSLRIPEWSRNTVLKVNGVELAAEAGAYSELEREWKSGDKIELQFDMRCRIIDAPRGSNREGDNFQALIRGPVVLSRDENIDPDFDQPVQIKAENGYVKVIQIDPKSSRLMFKVPTTDGFIEMVDYASVDSWSGKKVCTWLPMLNQPAH